MRVLAIAGALMLAACQPAGVSPPEASSATPPEASVVASSASDSSASVAEVTSASGPVADPDWLVKQRGEEKAHLTAHPDVAARTGDTLTISLGGKPVATFTDKNKTECEGNETCSIWYFDDVIALQSPPGKTQTYAHLVRDNGEITEHVLVSPEGTLFWPFSGFRVSKDGRFLAAGLSESLIDDGFFRIVDFASRGHHMQAEFDAQCDVAKWKSPRTVSVVCSRHDDGSVSVAADVSEVSPGTWRFQETAILKKPEGEKVELKSQTLSLTQKAWTAAQQAELTAYDQKIGYKRLVP